MVVLDCTVIYIYSMAYETPLDNHNHIWRSTSTSAQTSLDVPIILTHATGSCSKHVKGYLQWIRHCPLGDGAVVPYSVVSGLFQHLLGRTDGNNSTGTQTRVTSNFHRSCGTDGLFQSDRSRLTMDSAVRLLCGVRSVVIEN
jgi:hypothetical protein